MESFTKSYQSRTNSNGKEGCNRRKGGVAQKPRDKKERERFRGAWVERLADGNGPPWPNFPLQMRLLEKDLRGGGSGGGEGGVLRWVVAMAVEAVREVLRWGVVVEMVLSAVMEVMGEVHVVLLVVIN